MTMTQMMGLLGGLALFLYGMQMMSNGLEAAAGNKMKQILEKLTANRFLGVLVGAVITAIIQSSSATTVMVVGFVNSGMMTLTQAVWIIMGANIGTTITGQLIALDVGAIAPFIAFLGVAIVVFMKNEKLHHIGNILAGLGILFIGMDMMSDAMKPLRDSQAFVDLLTNFENPVLGILAGAGFTAIIQSSSASVGILQALASSGIIQLSSAAFVLFGMNIGTCITAFLASIGTSKNAKRTTVIHITFNVIGTVIFTTLCLSTALISLVESWTPDNASAQIANLHTTFNIVTSILLIPFGTWLTKFAQFVLRDKGNAEEMEGFYLLNIKPMNTDKLGVSAISMEGTRKELMRMLQMARENVHNAFEVFASKDTVALATVEEKEEYIDYLNKEISKYNDKQLIAYRKNNIGFVFQFYNLVPNLTALENVELATQIGTKALNPAKVLERVGLGERLDNFPAQLSGGEQQRVSIARALAKNPKLLLCDEPTGALDYNTGKQILKLLQDTSRETGMTVIVITHNQALTPMADRVISMKSGRVVSIETNENPVSVADIEW